MKVVNKIFTLILLVFITLSSAGISFYLHECGCRQSTFFSIEAGYSEADEFCCCSPELVSAQESACDCSLAEEQCCKEKYFFFLLPVGPDKVKVSLPDLQFKLIAQINTSKIDDIKSSSINSDARSIHAPSGIKSGKELVYYLSQIKIPFPIA
jgi:hypothetical protein